MKPVYMVNTRTGFIHKYPCHHINPFEETIGDHWKAFYQIVDARKFMDTYTEIKTKACECVLGEYYE